ncbi:4-oxalocrotonate tautomerase family protein [Caballeronia sp. LZ043]|uniref:tautomerase family protein n=1 Tax=Caballeronia sp. LZ043 TaxID=3038569 RepID=UPI002860210B|nr:4-oxalocrotonate tautomerase family protein [Caballeronia sp. LZ043]MDR5825767.1 4-oxalocrotonate tautomerase family protein [Caballeronia sp. LZ043]
MPHITIQLSGSRDRALGRRAAEAVSQLTADILGKKPSDMAVTLDYIADEDWLVGGKSLAELSAASYFVEVSITDETNTKAEKAEFIRQVHEAMRGLRAAVHEVSYVYLIDARATAYGFGGRTQEWRHQQAGV